MNSRTAQLTENGFGNCSESVARQVLLTPKDVSAIRHDEANKYSALFTAELPNSLQIASLNSGTPVDPSRRPAINTYTANKANKEVICQSEATPSNRMQCLRL